MLGSFHTSEKSIFRRFFANQAKESPIIGIDLGTTNWLQHMCCNCEGGTPKVLTNAEGARTTPSIVAFTKDGQRLVNMPSARWSQIPNQLSLPQNVLLEERGMGYMV
ncbi:chaperone DnaK [Histomonas meleagridis]|uniref:chaperone DnaK n=1 Tax=Histomonas meleagridis TaxID=135588 RepID=UPI0035597564|nr:chaperone DnaK [Histomonas meleagridis]KAH0798955.1 chaperone DnaK [Histomonas meleagridis]